MTKQQLEEQNAALAEELALMQSELAHVRQSHGKLCRGIKEALGIENWPDFRAKYGPGEFADQVARFLKEEVAEMKAEWC